MENEKWMIDILKAINYDPICSLPELAQILQDLRSVGLLDTPDEKENKLKLLHKVNIERETLKERNWKLQAELEKCRENKNKAARLLANASKRYHELDDELEKVKGENERLREALEYIAYGDKSNFVTWGDVRGAAKRGLKTEASDEEKDNGE